ncbi:hypothetical protein UlMin_029307 [Ulmus minor]
MSNITVCARFRPLSSREKRDYGDAVCIQCIDSETFVLKDEKEENLTFSFDRVFYENSEQAKVYEFLALPIVRDAVNAINGTIITYGQTGAGKTYSMEGPGILECDEQKKGLLPRVVDGIFEGVKSSEATIKYSIKLSMVEIYMERVRDLFDLAKDNIQIKENKAQGIVLHGVTEISLVDPKEALQSLASGIANRAVGETQMNIASSRSHCVYIFTLQKEFPQDNRASHIKASPRVKCNEDKFTKKREISSSTKDESCERILNKLRERLDVEDVNLLEELFVLEGIFFDPNSVADLDSAYEDVTLQTITSLQQAVEELASEVEELKTENKALKDTITAAKRFDAHSKETGLSVVLKVKGLFGFCISWIKSLSFVKMLK